jgi:hemolysin activation/secretion protein
MTRMVYFIMLGFLLLIAFTAFAAEDEKKIEPNFAIKGYRVEGNTLIPSEKLDQLLSVFTGPEKNFEEVQKARRTVEKAYYDKGFTAVQVVIPEQILENGLVRLEVIESNVGKIKIEGNRFFDEVNILNSLPALQPGKSPNTAVLSTNLKMANESPAKKVNLQLKNSDQENKVEATVEVRDEKPWKVGLTLDNSGEDRTGLWRLGGLLQHANIFNRDHLLTLQYITSPTKPDQVSTYGLGYRLPFYNLGATLDFVGAYSNVSSGSLNLDSSTAMQVSGKGTILGLHFNQTLPGIRRYEHKLILGLDYRAYVNDVNWEGNQLGNDVTVHPVSLTYAGTLTLNKFSGGFFLGASYNLPGGWSAKDEGEDFEKIRSGAREDYTVFRFGANILYPFIGDWQARVVFNGQNANTPLIPGEQFGIGGANSVRGFQLREAANDNGYAGSFEVISPNLAGKTGLKSAQCRALIFYDRGEVSRINPLPGETTKTSISSSGVGLRITDGRYFTLSADYGFIIDPINPGKGSGGGLWHLTATLMY